MTSAANSAWVATTTVWPRRRSPAARARKGSTSPREPIASTATRTVAAPRSARAVHRPAEVREARGRREVRGRVVVDGVQVGRHRALVEHAAGGLRHQPPAEPAALRRRTGDDGELVAEGVVPLDADARQVLPVAGSTATSTSPPNGHSHSGTDGSSAAIQVPASGRSAGAVLHRNTPVKNRPVTPAAAGIRARSPPLSASAARTASTMAGGTDSTPDPSASDTPTTEYTLPSHAGSIRRADPTVARPGPSPWPAPQPARQVREQAVVHGSARRGAGRCAHRQPRNGNPDPPCPVSRTPSTWCSWMSLCSKPSREPAR